MPQEFQTSFIPKQDTTSPARKNTSVSLPTFIGILVVVISVLAAVGVFGYKQVLEGSIVRKEQQLQDARAAFDPELIRDLEKLDSRLRLSKDILNNHVAPSGLFDFLEDFTLASVQFTSFKLTAAPGGGITLLMDGEAPDFESLALQSDEFGNDPRIQSPIFSDFDVSENGTVTFSFSGVIDPTVLQYGASFSGDSGVPNEEVPDNENEL